MIRLLTCAFFLYFVTNSFCQKIPLIHSGDVIDRGKVLYDSGKYDEAIKEFNKVPERDTNYVLMLTEAALAYIGAEKYDEALAVCEKGLSKPSEYARYFIRDQAIAEDKKGNFDRSIQLFQDGIKKYPADYVLLYNMGITYYNNKKYEKAADVFFKVLTINPFHSGSHLNLGRISIGQGRKVHTMLSLGMYLSISNTDNPRLVLLNNFLDNEVTEEGSIPVFGTNAPDKLDQIVRAKIAMDKNFKSEVPVDAAVVRQFEMFFQQLNAIPKDTDDPWVKAYLPIYQYIQEHDLIEPFIYHLLSSSSNTTVKKWIGKNDKILKGYYESVAGIIKRQRETWSLEVEGVTVPVQAWYDDDKNLDALGAFANDIRKGHWIFFYNNSEKSAEGDYDDNGKKKGVWKYYHNDGTVKSIEDYSTGEVTVSYPAGGKREHFYLKDSEIHGDVELFYPCGPLKEKLLYRDGKRHGKGQKYYPSGTVQKTYSYADDKTDGELKTYYPDGQLELVSHYKADRLDGSYQLYYANKKLQSEGRYLNDLAVGPWVHYYPNGNVKRKGNYDDKGRPVGEWSYYDEQGKLTEKRQFDDEGRLHGANTFYYDDKIYNVYTYRKDVIIAAVFYDADGKEFAKSANNDGNFAVRNYFPGGQLQSEGNYRKGKRQGSWKYYNRYGKLLSLYNYEDGLIQGKGTEYYPSGETKYLLEYKDNELHGYFQELYRNGNVKQEGWFQNGKREQQWFTYYPDGTLETDAYYLLNDLRGPYYSYSLDGKLHTVYTYENDLVTDLKNYDSKGNLQTIRTANDHSIAYEERFANKKLRSKWESLCGNYVHDLTKWYPDGTLYFKYSFLDGQKYGQYVSNQAGGNLSSEGMYVNNKSEGLWKTYHTNGQLSKSGNYLNGLTDSVWNFYYPDGKISSALSYRNDELHGICRYHSPEGEPLLEKMYVNGDLIAYRIINENSESAPWQDFSGTGTISIKNAAGKVVYEESYKDGLRHGAKKVYFNNGKLQEEYHYDMGDFEGPYAVYYQDGKVRQHGTYKDNALEGKFESFRPDGTPEKSEEYRMGSRHGKAVYYLKGTNKKQYTFWDDVIE